MAEQTWKDRLVDASLSEEEATEFEQLVAGGADPDDAINLLLLKRHHDGRSI